MCFVSNFKSLVLLVMPGLLAAVPVYAGNIHVEYDQHLDKITIQATNASLTSVLAEIANKTNMTIQIDPAVEKQVSFQLRPQPLQQALQKVVKGLSYVIEYKIDEKQQTVVSGLRLLPKGKQDSGQLVSVAVLNARASRSGNGGGDAAQDTFSHGGRSEYRNTSRIQSGPNQKLKRPNHQKMIKKIDDNFGGTRGRPKDSLLYSEQIPQKSSNKAKKLTEEQLRELDKQNPSSSLFDSRY